MFKREKSENKKGATTAQAPSQSTNTNSKSTNTPSNARANSGSTPTKHTLSLTGKESAETLQQRIQEAEQKILILREDKKKLQQHEASLANVEKMIADKKARKANLLEKMENLRKGIEQEEVQNAEMEPMAVESMEKAKKMVEEIRENISRTEKNIEDLDKENERLYNFIEKQNENIRILEDCIRTAGSTPAVGVDNGLLRVAEGWMDRERGPHVISPEAIIARRLENQYVKGGVDDALNALEQAELERYMRENRMMNEPGPYQTVGGKAGSQRAALMNERAARAAATQANIVEESVPAKNLFAMFEANKSKADDKPGEYAREKSVLAAGGGSISDRLAVLTAEKKDISEFERERQALAESAKSRKNLFSAFEGGAIAEESAKEKESQFANKEFDRDALAARGSGNFTI
mmetsp:Transcript_10267/g.17607  ORF Transcript_10267/g.17607 Transcript_10267/m.17607 type:complete len:409 (+) Transcript_10267:416-1642(+)|eukprot:CAMPEP_0184696236 /NCGR_PEP_ID=MMETSP0313-20130426/3596_1 /TAXON_ID=2792 /ORGANISM="Porphyridium aerugineum, Strain SAG 1380-2" /LENGTH=408 /DNA_ID=CAMNT_0027154821 /DNA_START=346 /DNA_END=1572 /DNA_ORIENTATION=-